MRRDFLAAVQAHVARSSITASAVRGRGAAGTAAGARQFLAVLPLKLLAVRSPRLFQERLDAATRPLLGALPRDGRKWGRARKILNIFLRNALYSTYLSQRYRLSASEFMLELPLDSLTVSKLQELSSLPRWPGVAALDADTSAQYHKAAAEIAAQNYGCAPVHLDAYWWEQREADR